MELNKKNLFLVSLVFLAINSNSCSNITEHIRMSEEEGLKSTVAKHDAIMNDLKQYIGKHKSELRTILGKPTRIVSPSIWNDIKYDEEWVYERGIFLINKQYRMFFIKDNIIAYVKFGGFY